MSAQDDMVKGYLAGRESAAADLPECHRDKSAAFRHGWISGRNDRMPWLAEKHDVRGRRANLILENAGC